LNPLECEHMFKFDPQTWALAILIIATVFLLLLLVQKDQENKRLRCEKMGEKSAKCDYWVALVQTVLRSQITSLVRDEMVPDLLAFSPNGDVALELDTLYFLTPNGIPTTLELDPVTSDLVWSMIDRAAA